MSIISNTSGVIQNVKRPHFVISIHISFYYFCYSVLNGSLSGILFKFSELYLASILDLCTTIRTLYMGREWYSFSSLSFLCCGKT